MERLGYDLYEQKFMFEYHPSDEDSDDPDVDRVFLLSPSLTRFIPQQHEQVIGPANCIHIKKDYDNPPKPNTPDKLQFHYCNSCQTTWLVGIEGLTAAKSHPSHHTHYHAYTGQTSRALIVYLDGACPNNGNSPTRSSMGIYFGPQSKHNISRQLDSTQPTSQAAEISAAIAAVRQVRTSIRHEREAMVRADAGHARSEEMRRVWRLMLLLATDSSYLVECMCKHRPDWTLDPGSKVYTNKHGEVIKNSALFVELDQEIDLVSRVGVQVQWYHIPREFNSEADKLANEALA